MSAQEEFDRYAQEAAEALYLCRLIYTHMQWLSFAVVAS